MVSSIKRLPNALTKRQTMLVLRARDRCEAYEALREAAVPLLDMAIVVNPPNDNGLRQATIEKEKLQSEEFDLNFWTKFKDGGIPRPWDVNSSELLDFGGRIYVKPVEHLGGALGLFGEGAKSVLLKQMSRTWWLRKAKNDVLNGRFSDIDWSSEEDYLKSNNKLVLTGPDKEILERDRLFLRQKITILQELLASLLDRSAHQILNPMIERFPNPILELHKARFPDLDIIHDIMDEEKVSQVLKLIEAFLRQHGDDEKWLAVDNDERTNQAYTEWLDGLPFENDLINLAVRTKISNWFRENTIGFEGKPIKGLVGRVIRSNLRLLREAVPIAENGGKPLNVRGMAKRLNTSPVTLSRLETGKKAVLYPTWIRQYASVLGVAEAQFFPQPMSGLNLTSQVINEKASEGTEIVTATEEEVATLKLGQKLFEEREADFNKEMQKRADEIAILNTKLSNAISELQRRDIEHKRLLEEIRNLQFDDGGVSTGRKSKSALNTLPIFGRSFDNQFSDTLLFNDDKAFDFVDIPGNLIEVEGAFAVICPGGSMSPKYEHGDILYCRPHKRIRRGHFVVVEFDEDGERRAIIGRYLTVTSGKVTVEKLNPAGRVVCKFSRIFRIIGMTEAD